MPENNPNGVFDVARPGSTPAQQTGKPVITNNQPLQPDPMMRENPASTVKQTLTVSQNDLQANPKFEDGTLHEMFTENRMFGEIKSRKGSKIIRNLFLIIGFMLTLISIAYYFLVILKK